MANLVLAIIFPVLSVLLFKIFVTYKVHNFQAIVFNYFTAFVLCYFLSLNGSLSIADVLDKKWIINSFIVGALFIINFQLIALTAQKVNIATATLANKISLVIPVLASFVFFNEELPLIKFVAIFVSFIAIYLIITEKGRVAIKKNIGTFPY